MSTQRLLEDVGSAREEKKHKSNKELGLGNFGNNRRNKIAEQCLE